MKKIKDFKIYDYHFIYLFVLVILGGVTGFLIENTATSISQGYIDSRYQRLPCILGYGIVIFIMYIVFGTPDKMRFFNKRLFENKQSKIAKHILYFLIVTAFIFLAEWGAGELFELLTGTVLWNYSNIPLHLGKYVCLPFTLAFGSGAYVLMAFIFTPFMHLLETKMPANIALVICFVVGIPAIIDFLVTTILLATGHAPSIIWRLYWPWYKEKSAKKAIKKLVIASQF